MRKRTFEDRKFSQGDSNSDAYRDNWDAVFGEKDEPEEQCSDCGIVILGAHGHCTALESSCADEPSPGATGEAATGDA